MTKTYKTIINTIVKKMKGYEWKVRDTDDYSLKLSGSVQSFDIIGPIIKVWCCIVYTYNNQHERIYQPLSFERQWLTIKDIENYSFKIEGYNFVLEDIGNSILTNL